MPESEREPESIVPFPQRMQERARESQKVPRLPESQQVSKKCPRLPDCQIAKLPERARMPDARCQMPEKFHPEIFLRFLNKVFPEVFERVMEEVPESARRVPESARDRLRVPEESQKVPRLPETARESQDVPESTKYPKNGP